MRRDRIYSAAGVSRFIEFESIKFPAVKFTGIVILWILYTAPFGFILFSALFRLRIQSLLRFILAKDHWWGSNTRNAHMVHIVNSIRFQNDVSILAKVFFVCRNSIFSYWGFNSKTRVWSIYFKAKQKNWGMFETLKSGNKTSSGEISLSIRIHARSKVWPMKGVTVYGHPPECRVTHLKWRINDSKISCFNFNYMYLVCVTVRLKFLGRRVVMICDRSQTICSARKFIEVVIFKGVLYGSFLSSSIIWLGNSSWFG